MIPRIFWAQEHRRHVLEEHPVVVETGPCPATRFRVISSNLDALEELELGDVRLHPDGEHLCVETPRDSERGTGLWNSSASLPPMKSAPLGGRSHLLQRAPDPEELRAIGWAVVTEGGGRRLLRDPECSDSVIESYLQDQIPSCIEELYLRVLRIAICDLNDSTGSPSHESRSVGVVLPWTMDHSQAAVERVAMALHYALVEVAAEQVVATLGPFSLQVYGYTALQPANHDLQRLAGSSTRWAFIQPEQGRAEDWRREAQVNRRTIEESRSLFDAFESPAFSLAKEDNPVRSVMYRARSLIVLQSRDLQTRSARDLAAGAPVKEIARERFL